MIDWIVTLPSIRIFGLGLGLVPVLALILKDDFTRRSIQHLDDALYAIT